MKNVYNNILKLFELGINKLKIRFCSYIPTYAKISIDIDRAMQCSP